MKYLFWADLEMTGLDPESCVIIEFAGIITDLELKTLDTYHAVVHQPQHFLDAMDEWNTRMHGASGLTKQVPNGRPLNQVEEEVLAFLAPYFNETERPILAGNSIHQDRRFIDKYMPKLGAFLNYRMVDVSSFKLLFKYMRGVSVKKRNAHRALDDIQASIEELASYLQFIQVDKPIEIDHSTMPSV